MLLNWTCGNVPTELLDAPTGQSDVVDNQGRTGNQRLASAHLQSGNIIAAGNRHASPKSKSFIHRNKLRTDGLDSNENQLEWKKTRFESTWDLHTNITLPLRPLLRRVFPADFKDNREETHEALVTSLTNTAVPLLCLDFTWIQLQCTHTRIPL